MFYMNMRAFNEGEQAEAYKKRKEEEKARKEKESDDRAERRYKAEKIDDNSYRWVGAGHKMTPQNPNYGIMHPIKTVKGVMNDNKRDDAIRDKTSQVKERDKNGRPTIYTNKKEYEHHGTAKEIMDADNAIRKHFRRHPEKLKEDCGIFESVEII